MVEPWNDSQRSLRRQILQAVQELKWTAIDVLRISYERNNDWTEEKFDNPVTPNFGQDWLEYLRKGK